eukprot:TRINITY_DN77061_c0_g1_i1.p1 TRINITY_DN77061_c0_g1~~TRINITY_DN77061_c0_g1_i1.p1  ORF type:complete len:314 (-),score=58.31 TRINITY_DN77061_c0_g1_i1:154-1071(-)
MFLCCCSEDDHDKSALSFERPVPTLETPVLLAAEAAAPNVAVAPSLEHGASMLWALREPTDEPLRPPEEDEPHAALPVVEAKHTAQANAAATETKKVKPAAGKTKAIRPAAEGAKAAPASDRSGPTDARITFTVSFDRSATSVFGVDISAAGKFCVVNGVTDGDSLVGSWNASVEADRRVKTQDRLLGINGYTSEKGKDLLDKLKGARGNLVLEFQRPTLFEVALTPAPKVGLGLGLKAGPSFLMVTSIDVGPAKEYNSCAAPQQEIKISSRVLAINGKAGTGDELMSCLTSASGPLKLDMVYWS